MYIKYTLVVLDQLNLVRILEFLTKNHKKLHKNTIDYLISINYKLYLKIGGLLLVRFNLYFI